MPQAALTESEVKELVDDWYLKLDVHAPAEELLPLLADEGLQMEFPEGTFRGYEGAREWYEAATRRLFDEVHTLKELKILISEERADIQLVINWQARRWNPPDAKSQWLGFDVAQTWMVHRSPQTKRTVIVRYVADAFTPMEGSASL